MVNKTITLMVLVIFICAGLFLYLNVEGFEETVTGTGESGSELEAPSASEAIPEAPITSGSVTAPITSGSAIAPITSGSATAPIAITLSKSEILQLLRPDIEAIISANPVKVDTNDIYMQLRPKIQELIHNTPLKIDPVEFINSVKPDLIKIIQESIPKPITAYTASGSAVAAATVATVPNVVAAPAVVASGSPALSQGVEYAAAAPGCKPFNINEWVRKDSIPCYGCKLPA